MAETQVRSDILITPEMTAMFVNVFRPNSKQATKDGRPKYTVMLVAKPEAQKTKAFKAMKAAVEAVAEEKWGERVPKKLKRPFLTPDDLEKVPDGLDDDDVFIRLSTVNKPRVVDRHVNPVLDEGDLYPGVVVKASVQAYTWKDDQGGSGVSFSLNNLQIVRDGKRLAGGSDPADDFESLDDDDDENMLD